MIDNTNKVRFVVGDSTIYVQEAKYCEKDFALQNNNLVRGTGYINCKGALVNEPYDFTNNNAISLSDMEGIFRRVFFLENYEKNQRFNLTRDDINFLIKPMSTAPKDSDIEENQDSSYYDSFVKLFMLGDSKDPIPTNIKIYNKIGRGYGSLIDCAFIQDFDNDLQFFLTACIYVNENNIFSDDNYEYDDIGIPTLANLGRKVYEFERKEMPAHLHSK